MTVKKDLQQKYLELQMVVQQVQQLQQQIEEIQHQLNEFNKLSINIEDIKDIKKGTDTLVPLGAGIFLKAQITDTSLILMNVGSNIVVEKQLSEAKSILEKQIKEVENIISDMESKLQSAVLYAQVLQAELQKCSEIQ